MARVYSNGDPRDLAICLSSADMAFDQSPLGARDQFRRWLIEVAVPASMKHRELTAEESSRFQSYSVSEIDLVRERAQNADQQASPAPRKRWWRFR
jgi:hypothetical protein